MDSVKLWKYQLGCPPPVSFQGKLYMACYVLYSTVFGIFQVDPPVKDGMGSDYVLHPPKLIATVPEGNLIVPIYMVECDFGDPAAWPQRLLHVANCSFQAR